MHGTRVVQKMIEVADTEEQMDMLVAAMDARIMELILDMNGNHVVQRWCAASARWRACTKCTCSCTCRTPCAHASFLHCPAPNASVVVASVVVAVQSRIAAAIARCFHLRGGAQRNRARLHASPRLLRASALSRPRAAGASGARDRDGRAQRQEAGGLKSIDDSRPSATVS